jgi:hypothetical protein
VTTTNGLDLTLIVHGLPMLLGVLRDGAALGLGFNPIVALVGAAIAAGLAGYGGAPEVRRPLAVAALLVAWLGGDGLRVLARARDAYDGVAWLLTGPQWTTWVALATWAVVGAAVGYVLPAVAGVAVGRRVHKGTGWLSAIMVSGSTSLALAAIAPYVADALRALGR